MLKLLTTERVNRIMTGFRDARTIPTNLIYLNRTRRIDAIDEELLAYMTQDVTIAPIIAEGQASDRDQNFSVETGKVKLANIETGAAFDEPVMRRINTIQRYNIQDEVGFVDRFLETVIEGLLTAVWQQQELMLVSRALDLYTYDRKGVKFSASWGTPTDLKPTVGSGIVAVWTDATNAKPITDIRTQIDQRTNIRGVATNRMRLPMADFDLMVATVEFRNKASLYANVDVTATNFPLEDRQTMLNIAGKILGLTVEFDDRRYEERMQDGTKVQKRYHPLGKVILDDSSMDNNPAITDLANTSVRAAIVDALAGGPLGLSPNEVGPVAYIPPPQYNPPGYDVVAAARSWPRKFNKYVESVLTVR